jgi:GT2 family glycosyltransferase
MIEHKKKAVSIIVPVYGDWNSLSVCISSLKDCVDTTVHKILLVNDCGPEADALENNILEQISNDPGFSYYRNPNNLGFVGTCNRAVYELDKTSNDILLLNSDTKVTPGFLDTMLAVLYENKNIATVSPRSNNATIATIPISAIRQGGVRPRTSHRIFQKIKNELPRYNIAPTAHGFCMLIKRSLINEHGLFDTVFGMGYGEEVDLCQRYQKQGFHSAISNHSYVFHLGAKSFTKDRKNILTKMNSQIINKRYPSYNEDVKSYINQQLSIESKLTKYPTLFDKILNILTR